MNFIKYTFLSLVVTSLVSTSAAAERYSDISPVLKSQLRSEMLPVISRANHYYGVVSHYSPQAASLANDFIVAADAFYRFLAWENDRLRIRREYYLPRRQFYYARRAYFDGKLSQNPYIKQAWESLEFEFHQLERLGLQLG